MSKLDEQDFDERRLARRQKRKRSQLIAYITLIAIIVIIIGLGVFGVLKIKSLIDKRSDVEAEVQQTEEEVEVQAPIIETPEVTQEPQEMSEEDMLDEVVNSVIAEMPLEDRVAGLFIVTPEQLTGVDTAIKAGSGTQDALSNYAVGGIVYASKNIKSEEQIKEMLDTTASMSKYPIFTITSDWGNKSGAVTSALGIDGVVDVVDADSAYNTGTAIASALFQYGFNMDMAPDMDITDEGLYGTDAAAVKDITTAFINGLQESGVNSCAYAFPADADTTGAMATIDSSKEDLVTNEYTVFKNAIDNGDVRAIMISNASFPNVTGDNTPASLSSVIIEDELRGALGFNGIVITGALDDGAITEYYTSEQAAVMAVKAGADMLYRPEDFKAAYEGLLSAVESSEISEDRINESLSRIFRIKYMNRINEITG